MGTLQRKELSSFDVAAVVRELKGTIIGSRVSNLYQLDKRTLLLRLHKTGKPDLNVILEAGRRLHLTSYALEKPQTPPAFCMALRKHLRNGRLINVDQHEFERVVILSFETGNGCMKLILELFGEGNVILVGEDGKILQALSYKKMRDRDILRGVDFQFAPSVGKNPLRTGEEELSEGLKNLGDVEVVRGIARFLGIGGIYSEEVLLRSGIDKTKKCSELNENETDSIFNELQELLGQVANGSLEPCIILETADGSVDVVPMKLQRYTTEGFSLQSHTSFNEALDEFYTTVTETEKAFEGLKTDQIKMETERLKRIVVAQERVLVEAETNASKDRRIGDAIYAHIDDLQALADKFSGDKRLGKDLKVTVSEALAEKRAGIRPSVFFEAFDSKTSAIHVCLDDLYFSLNLRRNLLENAAEYYERGKRHRQKLMGAKMALEETRKKLLEIEAKMRHAEVLMRIEPTKVMEELAVRKIKQKEWFERFRWFFSSDSFLVVAGRDAVSNEVLIKKYTVSEDLVFHADIVGAPFVVVKTQEKCPVSSVYVRLASLQLRIPEAGVKGLEASMSIW